MNNIDTPEDLMEDVELSFRPVAKQYGREMFSFVMAAGMASQAAEVLAQQAQKHRSRHATAAIAVLANSFNSISNAYAAKQGWDEGSLAQCDRDIRLAFAGRIVVAGAIPQGLDS